jgi:hypothetical protein
MPIPRLRDRLPTRHRPILLFVACALPMLVWQLAFYPGLVSGDSVGYTLQIVHHHWTTDYSVTYTALLWTSYAVTGDIALLVIAQALAFAAAVAYAAVGVTRLGAARRWSAAAALALCLSPMVGAFAAWLSKDVAFVVAQLLTVGALARVVAARAVTRRVGVELFAGLLLMCLFRNNGAPMVLLAAVLVALALPLVARRVLTVAAAALAGWLLLTYALFPAIGVHRAQSSLVLGTAYADIAFAYQHYPATFNGRDQALMASVSPLQHWRNSTNCYTSDQLDNTRGWDQAASEAHSSQLFSLWLRVVRRTPQAVVDARICRGAIAWLPVPPKTKTTALVPTPNQPPPDLAANAAELTPGKHHALTPHPPIHALAAAGTWLEKLTFAHDLEWVLWRGATWAWVSYLVVAALHRRRRLAWRAGLALVAVTIANQIAVLLDNPNQLARYMFGPLAIGVLLLPLLSRSDAVLEDQTLRDDRRDPHDAGEDRDAVEVLLDD